MRDVFTSLGRRWYLTAAGLLVTAGLGWAALTLVPATYQATGSIVLLPPASTVEAGGNPYLELGGLNQVADIVTRGMMSQNATEVVQRAHPGASYTVAPDPATSGPILVITADDKTAGGAAATLTGVMALLPARLADFQQALGYTGRTQITSAVLAKDDHPTTIRKTQIRALIAAAGAGVVLTAMIVALMDGLMERRSRAKRRRRHGDRPAGAAADQHPDDPRAQHDGAAASGRSAATTPLPLLPVGPHGLGAAVDPPLAPDADLPTPERHVATLRPG